LRQAEHGRLRGQHGRVVGRQAHAELDGATALFAARLGTGQPCSGVGWQGGDERLTREDRQRRAARLRRCAGGIADAAEVDRHAITRAPGHGHVPLHIAVASHRRRAAYPAIHPFPPSSLHSPWIQRSACDGV